MRWTRPALVWLMAVVIPAAGVKAQDVRQQLDRGDSLLEAIKPLKAQYANSQYFEMEFQGFVLGVAELSLTVRQQDGKLVYDYLHSRTVRLGDDEVVIDKINAVADVHFSPIEVHSVSMSLSPGQRQVVGTQDTQVGANTIRLRGTNMERQTDKEVHRPGKPLVIAASFAFQALDWPQTEPFAFRIFNPSTGGFIPQVLTPSSMPDGSVRLDMQSAASPAYYHLDKDRQLLAFQLPNSPVAFKRISKEKYDTFVQSAIQFKPAGSQPASQPSPGATSRPATQSSAPS